VSCCALQSRHKRAQGTAFRRGAGIGSAQTSQMPSVPRSMRYRWPLTIGGPSGAGELIQTLRWRAPIGQESRRGGPPPAGVSFPSLPRPGQVPRTYRAAVSGTGRNGSPSCLTPSMRGRENSPPVPVRKGSKKSVPPMAAEGTRRLPVPAARMRTLPLYRPHDPWRRGWDSNPCIGALQAPPLPLGHRAQTLVLADQLAENPYQSQERCKRLSGSLCSQKQKPPGRISSGERSDH
jgi:hypothetical protein